MLKLGKQDLKVKNCDCIEHRFKYSKYALDLDALNATITYYVKD